MTRSRQAQAANAGTAADARPADAQLRLSLDVPAPPLPPRPPAVNKRKKPMQPQSDGLAAFSKEALYQPPEIPVVPKVQRHILPKGYPVKFSEPVRLSKKFPPCSSEQKAQ